MFYFNTTLAFRQRNQKFKNDSSNCRIFVYQYFCIKKGSKFDLKQFLFAFDISIPCSHKIPPGFSGPRGVVEKSNAEIVWHNLKWCSHIQLNQIVLFCQVCQHICLVSTI